MQTPTAQPADLATVVGVLRRESEVLVKWLDALAEGAWQGRTACSEWPVYKVVSHCIGQPGAGHFDNREWPT